MRKMITVTLEDRREGRTRRQNGFLVGRRAFNGYVTPTRLNPLGIDGRVGRRVSGERRRG